jgi:hypothetical protein
MQGIFGAAYPYREADIILCKKVLPVVWKNPAIQKLFPNYALDQHGQPVKSPYDALPALTLQDSKDDAPDLSKLDEVDIVKNGPGAMLAHEHVRYGLAAGDQPPASPSAAI